MFVLALHHETQTGDIGKTQEYIIQFLVFFVFKGEIRWFGAYCGDVENLSLPVAQYLPMIHVVQA